MYLLRHRTCPKAICKGLRQYLKGKERCTSAHACTMLMAVLHCLHGLFEEQADVLHSDDCLPCQVCSELSMLGPLEHQVHGLRALMHLDEIQNSVVWAQYLVYLDLLDSRVTSIQSSVERLE